MEDETKRGRPPRAEASRKALAGIDVGGIDPLDVLRAVAADSSAPASARVAAAKALLEDARAREIQAKNEAAMADVYAVSPGKK
jgi:hypothetical protein